MWNIVKKGGQNFRKKSWSLSRRTSVTQQRRSYAVSPGDPKKPSPAYPLQDKPLSKLTDLKKVPFRALQKDQLIALSAKQKKLSEAKAKDRDDGKALVKSSETEMAVPADAMIVFHWPRLKCNGKGTGHFAIYFPGSGNYLSYFPIPNSPSETIGVRNDIDADGFRNSELSVVRKHADRDRKFEHDVESFGPCENIFMVPNIFNIQDASFLTFDALNPATGGLPIYQLIDSKKGAKDRKQCASVAAEILGGSVKTEFQAFGDYLSIQYEPDHLATAIAEVAEKVEPIAPWSSQESPYAVIDDKANE